MFYEELKQIIRSVMEQGLSGHTLTAELIANVNPDEIYESDNMLVTDSYFSLLHYAAGEEMITDAEWKYFLECLNGDRNYSLDEKLSLTVLNGIDGAVLQLPVYEDERMKTVILSADGDSIVYLVPDAVADNLEEYCLEFCTKWLRNSPDAKKYRQDGILCYTEKDFIDYLNAYVFPECESKMIKNLGWTNLGANLPEEYRNLPYYNF